MAYLKHPASLLAALFCVSPTLPTGPWDIVEWPNHPPVYSPSAYEAGRREAERDIREGCLIVEIHGGFGPPWLKQCITLLEQRYGIYLKGVGGCMVDGETKGHELGYNLVSRNEIRRRFGGDVLEETKAELLSR